MGRLTTHVLDVAAGRPARGMVIELRDLDAGGAVLGRFETNADGRLDAPALEGAAFRPGRYELLFHVGAYFGAQGGPARDADGPPFLDEVPVRFGVADADAHYHVPLLVTPWSYATYRGS